jgi:DNA-binding transcriptional regulator YiaG
VNSLRKASAGYRREIAELKRQVTSLQRELKAASKVQRPASSMAEVSGKRTRFVPKGVKSLRARLGLSAADFGLLVGASGQSVYNWEAGKAVPRQNQQAALAVVRGLGKREAIKRLEALSS